MDNINTFQQPDDTRQTCREYCTLHTLHRFQAEDMEAALKDHSNSFAEEQPTHVHFLDLSWNTIWRWVVSFTPQALYP